MALLIQLKNMMREILILLIMILLVYSAIFLFRDKLFVYGIDNHAFIICSAVKIFDANIANQIVNGEYILTREVGRQNEESIKWLLNNGSIFHYNGNMEKAINIVISNNNYNILSLIISKGYDVNYKYPGGETLLYMSLLNTNIEMVEYLINNGSDVNIQNDVGNTPLHLAVIAGNKRVENLLLKHGANKNIKNNFGLMPEQMNHSE